MASIWQNLIPDSLLFEVFTYLVDVADICKAAQVCKKWYRIAQDDHLWHRLASFKWEINSPLAPGRSCWRDEVKRLSFHVPTECCETLLQHNNEVLDVTFSHDGRYFCTTSKDATVLLFGQLESGEFELVFRADMQRAFHWTLCQYSVFSPDDNLLLVCGVDLDSHGEPRGCGAVVTIPVCDLVFTLKMEPATLFGGWLTNRIVLGGVLHPNNTCDIMAYKVPIDPTIRLDNRLDYSGVRLFRIRGQYHLMNLLIAHLPCTKYSDSMECWDTAHTFATSQRESLGNSLIEDIEDSPIGRNENSSEEGVKCADFSSCTFPSNSIYYYSTKLKEVSSNDGRDVVKEVKDLTAVIEKCKREGTNADDYISCDALATGCCANQTSQCGTLSTCNDICDAKTTTKANNKEPSDESTEEADNVNKPGRSLSQEVNRVYKAPLGENRLCVSKRTSTNLRHYVMFVNGIHDAIEIHEISNDMLERLDSQENEMEDSTEETVIKRPDHLFEYENCYIVGLALSPDNRFLYLNYRDIDKTHPDMKEHLNGHPVDIRDRIFQMEIRISCIDLEQMSKVKDIIYEGHQGFSSYPAWYICLDVGHDFIGSCSEDNSVYIWDKQYRRQLASLAHNHSRDSERGLEIEDQDGWVTNGVAFCPVDEELCVTVGDDFSVKIWRSKNRIKQLGISEPG